MQLSEEVQSLEDWIIEKRRYFHRHPELSFEEKETTAYLVEELKKMGLEPHTYPDYHGVWAALDAPKINVVAGPRMSSCDHYAASDDRLQTQ